MFHLIARTHLASLADAYLNERREHPRAFRNGGIFAKERVIVPTRGIGTWLEQRMVKEGVVVMGFDFPVLSQAFRNILHQAVPDFQETAYAPNILVWHLYCLLTDEALLHEPVFFDLKRYLVRESGDQRLLRIYQFATRLASLYDQYQSYLPCTMASWAKGENLNCTLEKPGVFKPLPQNLQWQSHLWHRLRQSCGLKSPAEAIQEFQDAPVTTPYPPLVLFGATMMPPSYLDILKKYARHAEVHFYYHLPSREFFGDNQSPKKIDDDFIQNDLLADYGKQAQEFFNAVIDMGGDPDCENEPLPAGNTLLERIQKLVLTNVNPSTPEEYHDDSLTIHKCFHPLREVEALRDALLFLLQQKNVPGKPAYTMNDIIVMAPNIAQFAPAIKAVFDESPLKDHYAVTDRSIRQANLLASSFLEILQLSDSNFEFSKVDALLDAPTLRKRFGFSDQDVAAIRLWLADAKVRFGYNGAERAESFGTTDEQAARLEGFTWQQALDRMLLAIAVELPPEETRQTPGFAGLMTLPVDGADDDQAALGNLALLLQKLHQTVQALHHCSRRTGAEWREFLDGVLEEFFDVDADCAQDFATLRGKLQEFADNIQGSPACDMPLPASLMLCILQGMLEGACTTGLADPFLGGKITCCSMMPMRGVPCKVIALLGMDDGAFPRQEQRLGFSLVNDANLLPYYTRSKTDEDRYLFLEALMAPSDHLMIFYQAFDPKTGTQLQPSPVVAQLSAYAKRVAANASLEIDHRLNAFDSLNFRKNAPVSLHDPFSYDSAAAEVAQCVLQNDESMQDYRLDLPDEPLSDERRPIVITLDDLARLFKEAPEFYKTQVLGFAKTTEDDAAADDRESIALDSLEKWQCTRQIAETLRQCRQENCDDEEQKTRLGVLQERLLAQNLLPLGQLGGLVFQSTLAPFDTPDVKEAIRLWSTAQTEKLEAALTIDGHEYLLRGNCELLTSPDGQPEIFEMIFSKETKAKYKFATYLKMLLRTIQNGPATARLLSLNAPHTPVLLKLPEGCDAGECLASIVRCYLDALVRPQPLFPETSWKCSQQNEGTVTLPELVKELRPYNLPPVDTTYYGEIDDALLQSTCALARNLIPQGVKILPDPKESPKSAKK